MDTPDEQPDQRPYYAPFTPLNPEVCTCVDPFAVCPTHG